MRLLKIAPIFAVLALAACDNTADQTGSTNTGASSTQSGANSAAPPANTTAPAPTGAAPTSPGSTTGTGAGGATRP